jgi:hypothetical protein
VRRQFLRARPVGTRGPENAFDLHTGSDLDCHHLGFGNQLKADLAPAGQLDIDLCEQFGVEQCAVQGAVAAIYAIPGAQRIERVLRAGMARAG